MANYSSEAEFSGANFGGVDIGQQINYNEPFNQRKMITEWLSPLNFAQKQQDVYDSENANSKNVFLGSKDIRDWQSGKSGILWCQGMPSSGKTVLNSIQFEYIRRMTIGERGAALACIYCEYKEHDAQTPTNPLASLWPQLNIGEGQDAQLSLAENLYAAHGKAGTRPSLPEIQTLIQATVRNLDEVYILVDGLDECPSAKDRHTFIDSLDQLLIPPGRQEGRVHLLITSRLRNDMFQAVTEVLIRPSCSEIENLVRTALAKPGFFQSPQMRSKVTETLDLKNTIVGSIAFNAAGMFLAARLHLNSLESLTNVSEIRHALQTLPESLDKLYGDAWARILDQEHNLELLAQQTVSWLFLAERQLRTHELCHALAVQPEDGKFDFERLIAIEDIVRACKGLITVDKHSQIVRFVHSTAQQFFLRVHPQLFPKAQTKLAVTCVTYLNLDFFRVAPCDFVSLRAADARRVKQRF